MKLNILVTGGLGYIGSHTVLNLLQNTNHNIVVIDNLINSNIKVLEMLESLSKKKITFYQDDVGNYAKILEILKSENINSVIHFAAVKSVRDSILHPDFYYHNNVVALMVLLNAMRQCDINKMIFSSSATVYSPKNKFPVKEDSQLGFLNPYGQTKLIGEDLLIREHKQSGLKVIILRYFNPIGNEATGHLGDHLTSQSTNIMPMIFNALKKKEPFFIYGGDYPSRDGSPVRDYIHVCDLAEAHRLAADSLEAQTGYLIFNVGLGSGVTVLELISKFNEVNQLKIPIKFENRRDGDLSICFANSDKIKSQMAWKPKYDLTDMCRDAFSFYRKTIN